MMKDLAEKGTQRRNAPAPHTLGSVSKPARRSRMTKPKLLSIVLLGSMLVTGIGGSVSAQPWDRDWDRGRRWDRDWDRDREWRGRGLDRDCYWVRRRMMDRDGDVVIRRYRRP